MHGAVALVSRSLVSLAASYPGLALEWHPTRYTKHADEVTRASGYDAKWICEFGHQWQAVVYQRTGCPECDRLAQSMRAKAAAQRRRQRIEDEAEAQLAALPWLPDGVGLATEGRQPAVCPVSIFP